VLSKYVRSAAFAFGEASQGRLMEVTFTGLGPPVGYGASVKARFLTFRFEEERS